MGGLGDFGARIDAERETARTGLRDEEIGHKVHISISCFYSGLANHMYPKIYNHTEGKLVQIPGLPAMYDYEFLPHWQKVRRRCGHTQANGITLNDSNA
jgi:hypothetical protein